MATILYTSLAEIKSFNPCPEGWKDILKGQGKTREDDVLFPLVDCLKSNSISDVCWLLGKRKIEIDIAIKFAKKCADSVSHIKNASAYASASASAYAAAYADTAASAYAAAAADTAAYAAYASAAAYAYDKQRELNKQFLIDCIKDWEESH
jgi:hypothetical protein